LKTAQNDIKKLSERSEPWVDERSRQSP